ncbi:hypothetical protein AVEN_82745-1 [Araneus ventricosus]|uniref:Uncharacterized protein n=1 Tax=Araneus ventricosus TaxID=182803 RepID=A0A4Y2EBD5_ARAVE|nr:hypothetical protein AVEN_82745-1 [Araneus ventricosus]
MPSDQPNPIIHKTLNDMPDIHFIVPLTDDSILIYAHFNSPGPNQVVRESRVGRCKISSDERAKGPCFAPCNPRDHKNFGNTFWSRKCGLVYTRGLRKLPDVRLFFFGDDRSRPIIRPTNSPDIGESYIRVQLENFSCAIRVPDLKGRCQQRFGWSNVGTYGKITPGNGVEKSFLGLFSYEGYRTFVIVKFHYCGNCASDKQISCT